MADKPMTDREVQNTAFRVECMKVLNATFSEIAEMMDIDPEYDGGQDFCKLLGKTLTSLGTMSHTMSDEDREALRYATREAFIKLNETVLRYGLMAIYTAGDKHNV